MEIRLTMTIMINVFFNWTSEPDTSPGFTVITAPKPLYFVVVISTAINLTWIMYHIKTTCLKLRVWMFGILLMMLTSV